VSDLFGRRHRERESLIEAATTAWRPRAPDGRILPHPTWADLGEDDRVRVYEEAGQARALEGLLHASGLSTTARAVLTRILGESG
jgi:hypothetical protein